ncbi:MAG TPA: PAS domain S-box protein, partial [Candidatus Angelobacter sp.]|nr:PAS domain S-box protein [Candidatus Angelobacter sp.]
MHRIRKAVRVALSPAMLIVMAFTAISTFVAWHFAKTNERDHIHRMTRLATSAISADLNSDMEAWLLSQVRLARMWEFGEPTYAQWSAFAGLFLEHHPGCIALEWLDPKYEERWISRAPGQKIPLAGAAIREHLLTDAANSKAILLSNIVVSSTGQKQWITAVPIFQNGGFRGFVLGHFDVQRSLDTMLNDIEKLDFSVAVEEQGIEVFRLAGSNDENFVGWAQDTSVRLPGTIWQLRVWPKREVMSEMRSNLPAATLLFGAAAGLMLMIIAWITDFLRASQRRFSGILAISAEAVISMNADHKITLFNRAAESTFGYTAGEVLGQPMELLIPGRFQKVHKEHVAHFTHSDKNNLLMSDRRHVLGLCKDGSEFHMAASISKLEIAGETIFTIICSDVTEAVLAEAQLRKSHEELEIRVQERTAALVNMNQSLELEILEHQRAEEEIQELSRRMMRVQEEERRNLARELHDGATQNLVTLLLHMGRMSRDPSVISPAVLEEWMRLTEQSANELRTVSYLLHPPLLEELGLGLTLRSYVEGFAKRTGIQVTLSSQGDLDNMGFDIELAVFRIIQEALSNIHRHSGSRTATVRISCDGDVLRLQIADQGRGILEIHRSGVGLGSMRERARLLKGQLAIETGSTGTTIKIELPVSHLIRSHALAQAAPPPSG